MCRMVSVTNAQVDDLPGWFFPLDMELFRVHLARSAQDGPGDLAELGVYLGKSATLMGGDLGPGETFTVIDLFGDDAGDERNLEENADQYPELTRAQFEANYRALHGDLPVVVQDYSEKIVEHAAHGAHRFVHIDASHLYEHVVKDIAAARTLLRPEGVVVFDDYRSAHTPGVSAAVWEARESGLHPIAVSEVKLYATWGDPAPYTEAVLSWVRDSEYAHEMHRIGADDVVRVFGGYGSAEPVWLPWVPPRMAPRFSAAVTAVRGLTRRRTDAAS